MKPITLSLPKKPEAKTSFAATVEKLEDIKKSFAGIEIEIECEEEEEEVSKEDLENVTSMLYSNLDYIYNILDKMSERIWKTEDRIYEVFYDHLKGHLPPILSVEQLQKAIETLGIGGDYKVEKKTIYASDGSVEKLVLEIPVKK